MTEKRVFVQSPIITALRSAYFLVILFIIALVFNFFFPGPFSVTILIGFFLIVYALVLLTGFFRKKKTITCDSIGCQVQAKSIWEGFGKTICHFNWSEVTETLFTGTENPGSFFTAVVDGQYIKLLNEESNSSKSFENFVALVNQATPHLPYVWTKDAENLAVIEKNGWFKKVPR